MIQHVIFVKTKGATEISTTVYGAVNILIFS